MVPRKMLLAAALTLATALAPRPAAAAREGQWAVGLTPSYAFLVLNAQLEPDGGGAGLYLQYGVTDAISLLASGLWTGHTLEASEEDPGGLYQVLSVSFGISYTLDMGRIRPALDLAAGVLHLRYGDQSTTSMSILAGLSADYMMRPWLSVGLAFHYHAYLANPAELPVYFDAGPRVTVHF